MDVFSMVDTTTLVRLLQLPGFIIANLALYFFFNYFISNVLWIYFICFIISILLLKTDFLFWIVERHKTNKIENWRSYSKFLNFKGILISFKQVLFNSLYELFPVSIIWLCVLGVFYILVL